MKLNKQKLIREANLWYLNHIAKLEESLGIFETKLSGLPQDELVESLQCIDGLLSAAERTMEDLLSEHQIGPLLSSESKRFVITTDQLGFLVANAVSWRFRDKESLDARKTERLVTQFCSEMRDATTLPENVLKNVGRIAKEYASTIPLP